MKKRFLSIVLVICMVLTLVPTTVFAETATYDLFVGGDVGFKTTENNVTKNVTGGGTATLVRSTNSATLTLSNINISYDADSSPAIQSDINNLTIELEGTNTITLTSDNMHAMYLLKSTTIKGKAGSKLIINATGKYLESITMNSGADLTISDVTMTVNYNATTDNGSATGIRSKDTVNIKNTCNFQLVTTATVDNSDVLGYVGETTSSTLNIGSNANVTFDGWENALDVPGTLNLTGGSLTVSNAYDGIYNSGTLNLTGGTLNSNGSRLGIISGSDGKIQFAGTNATLTGGIVGWGQEVGSTSSYSVTGGTVVFQGGNYAANAKYTSLASGYSVYAGSDKDNVVRISSPASYTFTNNKYVRIEPSTYYTLTLKNVKGATSASYMAGEIISYTAEDAPSDMHFLRWDMTVNDSTTNVGTNATYTGTMPEGNAILTAVYAYCSGGTATCQKKAVCSVCGKEYGTLALHNFTAEVVDSKYEITPVTCESNGVYYKSCPICGASSQYWNNATFIVSAPGHTESGWHSDAEGHWKDCTVCDEITTAKVAHTPDHEGHATEEYAILCSECGYVIEAKLSHTHTLTKVEATAPTCTTPGNIEYYVCGCGKWFKDAGGSTEITDHSSVVISKLKHSLIKTEARDATCTVDGNIEYYTCTVCEKLFADEAGSIEITEDQTVIKAGHLYEWVIDEEPTDKETGSKHEECKVCGDKQPSVVIPALLDKTAELQALLDAGGTVTLEQDCFITSSLIVSKNATLDLNGHVIRMAVDGSVIRVQNGITLTLKDSRPDVVHTGENESLPAGGVITGGKARIIGNQLGGGVDCSDNSVFIMDGGTIYDCSAVIGGGVSSTGVFTMNGGVIENCTAAYKIRDAAEVNIMNANGGIIKGTVNAGWISSNAGQSIPPESYTVFYDLVTFNGIVRAGIFYGGIRNIGLISGTYHTVSFDLNGSYNAIPTQWFVNIDTAAALEPADPVRNGYAFEGWYDGDTKYDFTQAVTENVTLTAHWREIPYPVFTGVANNETYCSSQVVSVSDKVGIESVTVNGKEVTLDKNGRFTLQPSEEKQTIVAVNKIGNSTKVVVTINDGHRDNDNNHMCDYCDTLIFECHKEGVPDHNCIILTNPVEKEQYRSGDVMPVRYAFHNEVQNGDRVIISLWDRTGKEIQSYDLSEPELGGANILVPDNIKGGTYILRVSLLHKNETDTELKEIWSSETKIALNGPPFLEYDETIDYQTGLIYDVKELFPILTTEESFTNAGYSVQYFLVGGTGEGTLVGSKLTVTKPGTFLVKAVVEDWEGASNDFVGTATLTVNVKAADNGINPGTGTTTTPDTGTTTTPDTGDNSHMALWIALLFVSGAGVIGTTVYSKKKRAK